MSNCYNNTTYGDIFIKAVYKYMRQLYNGNLGYNDEVILDVEKLKCFLSSSNLVAMTIGNETGMKSIVMKLRHLSVEGVNGAGRGYWHYDGNELKPTQLFRVTIFIYAVNGWLELNREGMKDEVGV